MVPGFTWIFDRVTLKYISPLWERPLLGAGVQWQATPTAPLLPLPTLPGTLLDYRHNSMRLPCPRRPLAIPAPWVVWWGST